MKKMTYGLLLVAALLVASLALAAPIPLEGQAPPSSHLATTKDRVLFYTGKNEVFVFDLETKTWQAGARLPGVVESHVVLPDNRVLVVGGVGRRAFAAIGDGKTPWRNVPAPPKSATAGSLGVLADGRVALVGGYDERKLRGTNETHFFDVQNKRWSEGPPLPEAAWSGDVFAQPNGALVYVTALPPPQHPRVFVLNASASRWTFAARAAGRQIASANILLRDGRVVLVGGGDGLYDSSPPTRVVTSTSRTAAITELAPTPVDCTYLATVAITDRLIGVVCGTVMFAEPRPMYVLDLRSGAWRNGPELPWDLVVKTAVLRGDTVFVFGHRGKLWEPGPMVAMTVRVAEIGGVP